ncbi:MAG: octanoyltransferase [Gammaproteobacteria bacterium RIFCSPLOWO2_02_FULL_56_15]|nr:MAG: octanoyltransferase [Gammaproteobacteria bacterium RIFCSPLOWO2_02_FULL_56_15]
MYKAVKPVIRHFGLCEYNLAYAAMTALTRGRDATSPDELWYLQHPAVYTLGLSGKREHILDAGEIPVVQTDRGGQVTYHGPGQLLVYLMLDLKRLGLGVRELVTLLEQSVIDMLRQLGITGVRRPGAPGVYVAGRKLSALGIRVHRSCCYHGLALNVDMDLAPFAGINPCGYPRLEVTRLQDLGIDMDVAEVAQCLQPMLFANLGLPCSGIRVEPGSHRYLQSRAAA